ncbi:MAG: hypothetical protein GQ581_01070 [Methyloprofundus sp.]|nr:hypothetical protein [Methyloprofundus sp.]
MNPKPLFALYMRLRNALKRKLGLLLFDPKSDSPILPISSLKHIVFIRWDAKWGDTFVSSLIFADFRKAYPDAKITVISSAAMAAYFRHYLKLTDVIEVPNKPSYAYLKTLAQQLGQVDLLIQYSKVIKIKDMYFLNKVDARLIAGLDDEIQQINIKLGEATNHLHFAQKCTYLLKYLNIKPTNCAYQIPLNPEKIKQAQTFLANKAPQPLLAINTSGNGKGRHINKLNTKKCIIEALRISPTINIVLLTTPDTISEVQTLCNEIQQTNVFYYPQCQTIYDAIALIYCASWVISVDTAIVHIATGLHKPLLALYNPNKENYTDWHPNSDSAISFFAEAVKPADINALNWQQLTANISKLLSS